MSLTIKRRDPRVRGPGDRRARQTAAWCAAAPIPYASACSATRERRSLAEIWRGPVASQLRADLNPRRIELLRRLPAEAPARRRRAAPQRTSRSRRIPAALVCRVHGGLQHLVPPGVLRARDRDHPHAPGRHARLRSLHARHRRSWAVARAHRLLQLRRGLPPQARRRDVREASSGFPAHLSLHQHQRRAPSPKRRSASLVHRASMK